MTKKEMILSMIGGEVRLPEGQKKSFWNRALKKDKEWMTRLYNFHLKETLTNPNETRNFCFALLNR